jgi:hypothetical protein
MAKSFGAKTLLIRDALQAHPDKGPKEIADLINASDARKQDKIEVKPIDVSQQKLLLKKAAGAEPAAAEKPAKKKPARKTASAPVTQPVAAPAPAPADPFEVIEDVFALAEKCGGFDRLKKLVDTLARARER